MPFAKMNSNYELKAMRLASSPPTWCHPPRDLDLTSNEVHVWRAALDHTASRIEFLQRTLSLDEQKRAERYYFQKHREHFVVARGLLRAILGHYLDVEPGQLRFRYNAYGKPALAEEFGRHGLRFNLAHSHGLVLYAVTYGREVGCDLEILRRELANQQIAERFFSSREIATLRALPACMQHEAFFNCWTRKEAFIKARGEGLSIPLDQFEVSLTPGAPAVLLRTPRDPQEASRWSLQELRPGPGYMAAVAIEGHNLPCQCWQWSE
jgi:4'-phosphopantetheinyl transferase